MALTDTPRSNRLHIAFYGRRNAGKSSLINLVTGQQTALVSEHAGTTTDPVIKSMELLPLGPIAVIDTAGLDDEGDLGALRIGRSKEMMDRTDLAVLVIATDTAGDTSRETRVARRAARAQNRRNRRAQQNGQARGGRSRSAAREARSRARHTLRGSIRERQNLPRRPALRHRQTPRPRTSKPPRSRETYTSPARKSSSSRRRTSRPPKAASYCRRCRSSATSSTTAAAHSSAPRTDSAKPSTRSKSRPRSSSQTRRSSRRSIKSCARSAAHLVLHNHGARQGRALRLHRRREGDRKTRPARQSAHSRSLHPRAPQRRHWPRKNSRAGCARKPEKPYPSTSAPAPTSRKTSATTR